MDPGPGEFCRREYLRRVNRKVIEQRVPLSGGIALTHRCNLTCVHCYLGDKSEQHQWRRSELSTRKWCTILDEVADAGCLYLLITGGEPLLRDDFAEIYTHAKTRGMLVSVFTNGTLISDSILALFQDLPPAGIEISLYGASAETYERITGHPEAFRRCLDNIERLIESGIQLSLKTMLMAHNVRELGGIQKLADDFGLDFRFDAAICPQLDGNPAPLAMRIDPKAAVDLEMNDTKRLQQWGDYFANAGGGPESDRLYRCGAGETNFYIGPYGNLQPCLMVTDLTHDLRVSSFQDGWQRTMPRIRRRQAAPGFACKTCPIQTLCELCPAVFRIETGSEQVPSEYICAMAHRRYEALRAAGI
jgi:radical SAM protein with 4Fe4S-binding SPASM domain